MKEIGLAASKVKASSFKFALGVFHFHPGCYEQLVGCIREAPQAEVCRASSWSHQPNMIKDTHRQKNKTRIGAKKKSVSNFRPPNQPTNQPGVCRASISPASVHIVSYVPLSARSAPGTCNLPHAGCPLPPSTHAACNDAIHVGPNSRRRQLRPE